MSKSLTYLGTFDDVVHRYPWSIPVDESYLRSMIVRHVLFGDRLLLNDGYLVLHPLTQRALMEGATNPLLGLIEEGFVAILSSQSNIVESVEARARSGVSSFQALEKSPFWGEVRGRLDKMSGRLNDRKALLRWPRKDLGAGFRAAMLRARGSGAAQNLRAQLGLKHTPTHALDAIFSQFEEVSAKSTAALRTKWEEIAIAEASRTHWVNRQAMVRELMGLANEAYHFNFASCLSAERDEVVGVDTRHSQAFDELLDTPELTYERLQTFSALSAPTHPAMYDMGRLRDFVIDGYKSNELKREYLSAQNEFIAGRLDPKQYKAVSDEYARHIATYFGGKFESKAQSLSIGIALFAGTTAADLVVPGLGAAAGAALGAVAFTTEQFVAPHVLRKVAVTQIERQVRRPDPKLSRVNALASVMIDKAKANQLVADLPDPQ